jgi:hypothetical protein
MQQEVSEFVGNCEALSILRVFAVDTNNSLMVLDVSQ